MAKKALLDVLEQTIGKYVKNLDAESLNVAVWSGKIELHKLELDVESVNLELDRKAAEAPNLGLPFKVVSGSFGSFEVDVPWAHLMSRSVVLRANDLNVLVEPCDRSSQSDNLLAPFPDEDSRIRAATKRRNQSIKNANKFRLQANAMRQLAQADEDGAASGESSSSSSTFTSRLVRRIIENLQIEVSNVHISLKDGDSSGGVVLGSLMLSTTDSTGKKVFVDRSTKRNGIDNSFLFKVLKIEGLGIYLDQSVPSYSNLSSINEDMSSSPSLPSTIPNHSYIVSPLSFEAKLRQADSNMCLDYPKYELVSSFPSLSILFSRSQLDLARSISEKISPSEFVARPLFPEYRPLSRVTKGTAVAWWKYAVRCIGRLNGRRSWVEFFLAFKTRKRYIELYRRMEHHTAGSWITPLNEAEETELKTIEQNRSISLEGIMSWRNIADAQVAKELQKRNKTRKTEKRGSVFSSIFGSKESTTSSTTTTTTANSSAENDDPPIHLTTEELKELEAMSVEEFVEDELSADSKLYDIKFTLGELKISLFAYDLRNITALEMGKVSTDFCAKADGSFDFDFKLTDLEIEDMVTPKSLFPRILRSLEKPETNKSPNAFRVHVKKTKTGDQTFLVKLAAFEAVASPNLVRELKRFFARAELPNSHSKLRQNPMLAQSLSGSVDLFYDADEGVPTRKNDPPTTEGITTNSTTPASVTVSDFSSVLIDAWKVKAQNESSWIIDVDIKAPVLVIPEHCDDPLADALVFDLGHLQLKYGNINAPSKVTKWFHDNPRSKKADIPKDYGTIAMNQLTVLVSKTGIIQELVQKKTYDESSKNFAVIEPISLSIDFGLENGAHLPRFCGLGVVPTISLRLSPSQAAQMMRVVSTWQSFLSNGFNDNTTGQDTAAGSIIVSSPAAVDNVTNSSSSNNNNNNIAPLGKVNNDSKNSELAHSMEESNEDGNVPHHYFLIGLQRLSVVVVGTGENNSIESHLVSASISMLSMLDGSSEIQLKMGWFWIVDRIEGGFVRQQRLLAHSNLPHSANTYASDNKRDILGELTKMGVFNSNFLRSNELADITIKKPCPHIPNETNDGTIPSSIVETILEAKFSSLFIHWNPRAVKAITNVIGQFTSSFGGRIDRDVGGVIVSPEIISSERKRREMSELALTASDNRSNNRTIIKAEMKSLEISLNSALDDLPLYTLTLAKTVVHITSLKDDLEASLTLGDLRLTTAGLGATRPEYCTLVGLAQGRSESLLTVSYVRGHKAGTSISTKSKLKGNIDAHAEIDLSPMRVVYIQSQILALVEYLTEGILGVIAAKAANSAKEAAREMANSVAGENVFLVKARSMNLILPESACNTNVMSLNAATLDVEYRMYPEAGGAIADVSLSDVVLLDNKGDTMQQHPIGMDVTVKLPPENVGDLEDQAMRVTITFSAVRFIILKSQFCQILRTLNGNIGEVELFLRRSSHGNMSIDGTTISISQADDEETFVMNTPRGAVDQDIRGLITHAGVAAVDRVRQLYVDIKSSVLALELCANDITDRIVRIEAVNALIYWAKFPHDSSMSCQASLGDLVCTDLREKAQQSQYRALVDQGNSSNDSASSEDLFFVSYKSNGISSNIDLKIGQPQLVVIPDAIAEIMEFFRTSDDDSAKNRNNIKQQELPQSIIGEATMDTMLVNVTEGDDNIETAFASDTAKARQQQQHTSSMSVTVKTQKCSVILVDLASQSSSCFSTKVASHKKAQLAEIVVIQGLFDSEISMATDIQSGKVINLDWQLHADSMELFSAFGREFNSPIQILDPAKFSVYGLKSVSETEETRIELRAAAISNVDIVFSMRNAALLSAILTGLNESLGSKPSTENVPPGHLDEKEALRIEQLASALDSENDKVTTTRDSIAQRALNVDEVSSSFSVNDDTVRPSPVLVIGVKITMPDAKLTLVNDLQGLDEALFKAAVDNFVASGEVNIGEGTDAIRQGMNFDVRINTSVLADYFDSSQNLWKNLLTQPWEITLKAIRGPCKRFRSKRLSTTVDLESFPCHLSISEQFLVSLAGANKMWSIYQMAIATPLDSNGHYIENKQDSNVSHDVVASAARNIITSFPYAIENSSGMDASFSLPGSGDASRKCPNGTMRYFRFEPPKVNGYGGKRQYGQDVTYQQYVHISFGEYRIEIPHLDAELGLSHRAHEFGEGIVLLTRLAKEGNTTVLHITSCVEVHNQTSVPFAISSAQGDDYDSVGICVQREKKLDNKSSSGLQDGQDMKASSKFCIPLQQLVLYSKNVSEHGQTALDLQISPLLNSNDPNSDSPKLMGTLQIGASLAQLRSSPVGYLTARYTVTCRSKQANQREYQIDPFVLQVSVRIVLVGRNHISVELYLQPRALIENRFPTSIILRSPMPHIFNRSVTNHKSENRDEYLLQSDDQVEVFTPGPSLATTYKTADMPIAGSSLDWMDGGWIDLPLVSEFKLLDPLRCFLPFASHSVRGNVVAGETNRTEFYIAEGEGALNALSRRDIGGQSSLSSSSSNNHNNNGGQVDYNSYKSHARSDFVRTFYITVCFYAVDHTGDLLFEQIESQRNSSRKIMKRSSATRPSITSMGQSPSPYSAFLSRRHNRRITLLPSSNIPLRLLRLTMDGEEGLQKSMPFRIEDIPIGEGGVDSSPIYWEEQEPSGYYAYRLLLNDHQSEIHVVPEYIVFNGSKDIVIVHERGMPETIVEPGKVAPLVSSPRVDGLGLALNFIELGCRSPFLPVHNLGLKVTILNSNEGFAMGSLAIQTVIDTRGDARLVIKIGEVNFGSLGQPLSTASRSIFSNDFFRFRLRWTELRLTLQEKLIPIIGGSSNRGTRGRDFHRTVATVIFSRFTVDWQRIFKEEATSQADLLMSPERSQLSVIIHNIRIHDNMPNTKSPIVFDSSTNLNFLDLCVRFRGPLDADLVKVDLFNLNLAHQDGQSQNIILDTSEDFVWNLLDLVNRILTASKDMGGYVIKLKEDEVHGGFTVTMIDSEDISWDEDVNYTPPRSDRLYDINLVRVSPFVVTVSFKRNPQSARYGNIRSGKGKNLMSYVMKRLKFTIEKAELSFARYEDRTLKGPPDRVVEALVAVYLSRMKMKLFTLIGATSFQDWRYLASRDGGDDAYVEGDILRATGHLAGGAAGYVFKKVGRGLGEGVSRVGNTLGNTIESGTGHIGARKLGRGVNSVVSGIGDGVGDAIAGVGTGTGKVFKGAGKGVGHVFGGVTGGAIIAGKGISKGLTEGDGRAVVTGFAQGVSAVGKGVGQGVESAVTGTADGLLSAGQGLLSGVQSVGRGIGGAFRGKKPTKRTSSSSSSRR